MIEERARERCLKVIRDIHAKRRAADTEKRETSLRALHDHRRVLLLYQANDVRVDEVALAQLSQLPEVRNFLTLFQWSSGVDSHENDKRWQRKVYNWWLIIRLRHPMQSFLLEIFLSRNECRCFLITETSVTLLCSRTIPSHFRIRSSEVEL